MTSLPSINPSTHPDPVHLLNWIDSIKHELQPPVGNKLLNGKGCEFKVMVVGGPNTRTDYHREEGEEWFLMLKGDMNLKLVDGGVFRDQPIRDGESFLLPGNIPHSPQRFPDTIGLVIERERMSSEIDNLRWYCPNCRQIIFEGAFHCVDLGSQLKPVIESYYSSDDARTCKNCGCVDQHPSKRTPPPSDSSDTPKKEGFNSISAETHPSPLKLAEWIEKNNTGAAEAKYIYGLGSQFHLSVFKGTCTPADEFRVQHGEEWFYQLKGSASLSVIDGGRHRVIQLSEGECFLLPARVPHAVARSEGSVGLVLERRRLAHELDTVQWYDPAFQSVVFERQFFYSDADALESARSAHRAQSRQN